MSEQYHPHREAEVKLYKDVGKIAKFFYDDNKNNEVADTNSDAPAERMDFPMKILLLLLSVSCIVVSFTAYNAYHRRHVDFFDPNGYLEPCNVTGAPAITELREMKEKIASIESEYDKLYRKPQKDLILADVKQAEKLSSNYTILEKHYKSQREIRLNCYKENLYPKVCTEFTAVLGCHLFAEIIFMALLFYYTSKYGIPLRRIILFPSQGYNYFFCIIWGACFFIQLFGYEVCEVPESYVKKFPL